MKPLTKVMMVLALGTVVSLCGVAGCKKQNDPRVNEILFMFHYNNLDLGDSYLDPIASTDPPLILDPPADPPINIDPPASHTPIPGSVVLFGSGLVGVALWGWRKRPKR